MSEEKYSEIEMKIRTERAIEILDDWSEFSQECRFKMHKHLNRTYRDKDTSNLMSKLEDEIYEYRQSTSHIGRNFDDDELLDIANMCMMLWTVKKKQEEKS